MTFVMNAQTGESLNFFYDPEKEVFTIRQWHEDENAPVGAVEHHVSISALMLARMVEEAGIADVEYIDEDDDS